MTADAATLYEAHARAFLQARDPSTVGVTILRRWAQSLPPGTETLEFGCGGGFPVTRTLVGEGLRVWGIDASPTLLARFRQRFPSVPVDCARALESTCFGRRFGAVVAIGLVFLLEEPEQTALIRRAAEVLEPGGRFLFTAPLEAGTWRDVTTGHACRSLGRDRYVQLLTAAGFSLVATDEDEGRNNHYDAERLAAHVVP